jgi:hypothetical protein
MKPRGFILQAFATCLLVSLFLARTVNVRADSIDCFVRCELDREWIPGLALAVVKQAGLY